jgi:hypothetical protein
MQGMLLYLIGLPTALAMGIMGNLLTPMARNALVARSTKRRDKRIAKIREEVQLVEQLRAEPSAAVAYVGRRVITLMAELAIAVAINGVALVLLGSNSTLTTSATGTSAVGILVFALTVFDISKEQKFFKAIQEREWYAEIINTQVTKLGVQPMHHAKGDSSEENSGRPYRPDIGIDSSLSDSVDQSSRGLSVPVACQNGPETGDIDQHQDDGETSPDQHRGS